MRTLKPNPAYKESGVPWLGEVPAHWGVRRFKYLLRECDTRSADGSEQLLRVSQYTGVTQRRLTGDEEEVDTRAESLIDYKCVEPDDLVVNIMLAWNGSMGVSQFPGITSPAYCVYRFGMGSSPWYFHYLLRSPVYRSRIKAVSTGVVESRLRLYTDDLCRLEGLVPPLSEQTAMVRFLDHADRRIRRYSRAKEKLIALLEEQKQAIIHQAVTGRIDVRTGQLYPAYKPSGIEWLGDVPAHWEVRRLGYLATKFGSGITPRGGATVYQESGVPFLRSQNIHFSGLKLRNVAHITERLHKELSGSFVKAGDVLLNITGASIGRACSVPDNFAEGNVNQHVCIIRLKRDQLLPNLLAAYLSTSEMQSEIQNKQSGASREGLTLQSIRNFSVFVPPPCEQESIVEFTDKASSRIESTVRRARNQIELLHEYRTRLIADVVTGKLDVREAAAALPEVDPLADDDDVGDGLGADETPAFDDDQEPAEVVG